MIDLPYLADVCRSTPSKIVFLVVDGLGGAAHPETRKSELETAHLPNLDALAAASACGLTMPVGAGITPGSGPGHMALFGYDPVKYLMGRGVLEALGIGVDLGEGDVAARGNFCTIDGEGLLTDRRAGRIPTAESAPLVELLRQIQVADARVSVYPVQDYRFVLVMSGEGLDDRIQETDPADHRRPAACARRARRRGEQGGRRCVGVRGESASRARRAASRQHDAAARILAPARSAALRRPLPPQPRRHRRLPDVSRPSQAFWG